MIQSRILVLTALLLGVALSFGEEKKPSENSANRKTVPGNEPALVKPEADGRVSLLAGNCEIYGKQIAVYEPQRCIGWWTSKEDYIAWEVELPKAGKYDVLLEWAITDEWAKNKFVIEAAGKKLEGIIPSTGGFDNYQEKPFGTLELLGGRQRITMRPAGPVNGELADLRKVTLVPVK